MNKQILTLLVAQFLSAFADNAIIFTVIAMAMHSKDSPAWYIPALQESFFVAFVVLAPWVGGIADNHAKSKVLFVANVIKAAGAGLLLLTVEPLFAYGVVGAGAALYSPAKYGILPELSSHEMLVKANSWIEGSTIFAILLGTVAGAKLADYSIVLALWSTVALYVTSALITLALPAAIAKTTPPPSQLIEFGKQIGQFFTARRARFALLGAAIFWATAAALRVILVAWAPLVLLSKNVSEIAQLTLYLALGIIAGAAIVPRLIPLEHLRRVRLPGYLMAILIGVLSFMQSLLPAQIVLFVIGMMGGLFIVPVNAALQELGKNSIGSGSAVAMQNFFQNLAMVGSVGIYTLASSQAIEPAIAMRILGGLLLVMIFLVAVRLPKPKLEKPV